MGRQTINSIRNRTICNHPVIFRVDMDQRKVTASVYGCTYDAIWKIQETTGIDAMKYEFTMHHSYSASATCSAEDEFDIDTGKRIAYRRLIKKYLRYRNARYAWYMKYLNDAHEKLALRHRKASQHEHSIDALFGIQ